MEKNDPKTSKAEVTQEGDDITVDWYTDDEDAGTVYEGPN